MSKSYRGPLEAKKITLASLNKKMSKITFIDEADISNKKVLLRVDFNVSLTSDGRISDDTRIQQALPTINYLLVKNNTLIIVSHLGSPQGLDPKLSLKPVADRLQELLTDYKVELVEDFLTCKVSPYEAKKVFLLQNIRFYHEEKENNPEFAKKLAALAEVYVNDGFGVCHRNDASIVGVSQYLPSYGGLLLIKEIQTISQTIDNPKRPFVVIMGGAKVSTKINLVEKLIGLADYLLIGGAMANTFWQAKEIGVGKSLVEKDYLVPAKILLEKSLGKIILPVDCLVGLADDKFTLGLVKKPGEIKPEEIILDIGPETTNRFKEIIGQARTIIWNGPIGYFENVQYRKGTDGIYQAIVDNHQAISIVGGGDTLTAISGKADNKKITHLSTGGGAMLEFIEKGTLPGIEALTK